MYRTNDVIPMIEFEVHRVERTHKTFDDTQETPEGIAEPVIHAFGYDKKQNYHHVKIRGVEPYCYVDYECRDEARDVDVVKRVELRDEDGSHFESVRGKRLCKLVTYTTGGVGELTSVDNYGWDQTYESDVLFNHRFIADMDLESGLRVPDFDDEYVHIDTVSTCTCKPEWRIHYVDIEVDDRNGFPENGREPIISVVAYDSFEDEYIIWLWDDSEQTAPDTVEGLYSDEATVREFDNERMMLLNYFAFLSGSRPSVFTAWNVSFDLVYLWDRAEFLNEQEDAPLQLPHKSMSPMQSINRSDWGNEIKGVCVFDLLKGLKSTQYTDMDSYRLEDVGQEFLDVGKEDYVGRLGDLWEDDIESLVEYNLRDVELMVELDRQQDLIGFWREVKRFGRCPLSEATVESSVVDKYLLASLHGEKVMPRKGSQPNVSGSYSGGAVFDAANGLFENVPMLDLASLYPMSMLTLNISPETKVDPEEYDGDTFVSPNGIHFRKDKEGITKRVIEDLLEERQKLKDKRDEQDAGSNRYKVLDNQQRAVKVIMNSLYGVLAWNRFRLYDQDGAKATTACGREVLDFTADVAEEMGHEVLYGDTDSVLLNFPDDWDMERCLSEAFDTADHINDRYADFARDELNAESHHFDIEFEKFYARFFQSGAKKRYAGRIRWKEGKDVDDIDITGYEYQRSDASELANESQEQVLKMICEDATADDVAQFVHEQIQRLQKRKVTLSEIGIPEGIGKNLDNYSKPTHAVRAAKYGNLLLGTTFNKNSKPKRYYIDDVDNKFFERMEDERGLDPTEDQLYRKVREDGSPRFLAVERAEQLPPEAQINWGYHESKNLKQTLSAITSAFGLEWSELQESSTQTGLDAFGD